MQVRHTNRGPQTSKQAKAEYKKYGPRISSQECRQLERGAELYRRAEKIRESEKKRQAAKKRKQEREDRERDARRRLNIPSQKPAIARSQCLLEGFVKLVKPAAIKEEGPKPEVESKPDPWVDDDLDDGTLLHAAAPGKCQLEPQASRSKAQHAAEQRMISTPADDALDIDVDDIFFSNTQIELEMKEPLQPAALKAVHETDPFLFSLSTQDVSMTDDDLEELGLPILAGEPQQASSKPLLERTDHDRILMPPPPVPQSKPKPKPKAVQLLRPNPSVTTNEFDDFGLSTQDLQQVMD